MIGQTEHPQSPGVASPGLQEGRSPGLRIATPFAPFPDTPVPDAHGFKSVGFGKPLGRFPLFPGRVVWIFADPMLNCRPISPATLVRKLVTYSPTQTGWRVRWPSGGEEDVWICS